MKNLVLTFAVILFAFGFANAQDSKTAEHTVGIKIANFALVDIEGSSTAINFAPTKPTEAGLGLDFSGSTDNSLWLNYSSIVASGGTRSISAAISAGLPGGTSLKVSAAEPAGGKGTLGEANTADQVLTESGVAVVSAIGSCYTESGTRKGSNLTYKLVMNDEDYDELYAGDSYSVTVTYTITE